MKDIYVRALCNFQGRSASPYISWSIISGATHRVVPPALWLLGPSARVVLSTIVASPKSAKQARHSELMRIFACRPTSSVNAT